LQHDTDFVDSDNSNDLHSHFQIAKASEYVSCFKRRRKGPQTKQQDQCFSTGCFSNAGIIGCWWCNDMYYGKTLFPQGAASEHGKTLT
jgi:hypothetical protein